jgi:hypothetical protein
MNGENLLWHTAVFGVSAFALVLGWQVDIAVAAVFWIVATVSLLAMRPD